MTSNHHRPTGQKSRFRLAPPGFRWRPVYFIPFILDTISSIAVVFMPVLVGRIIDLHSAGDTEAAWLQMRWLLVAIVYFALNEFFGWGITFRTQALLEREWRLYIGSLVRRSTSKDTGSLIAILNKDAKSLAALWQSMIMSSSAIGVTVLGTWQLSVLSPLVAVVALAGLILTILVLTYISKYLEKQSDAFREMVGINTSKASDIASSIRTILGLGAQGRMMKRYGESAEQVYRAQLKLESVQTWSYAARNMLVGTVTLLAVAFALRGTMNEGTWITDIPAGQLVTIVGLIGSLTGPIWSVEMTLFTWRNARVAFKRVDRLTEEETQEQDAATPKPRALPGFIENAAGGVHYINPRTHGLTAQEYAEKLTAALRSQNRGRVLLSEPNPMIFAGQLQEHLQLGTSGLSTDQMVQVLEITDAEEIAFRLGGTKPEDYLQAEISSEGANLSGGQRQRLALARALAQSAPTLVLTEPLNSVDEPSQKYILDRLEQATGQPGLLEHLEHIYIISTTMEADRRLARTQPKTEQKPGGGVPNKKAPQTHQQEENHG